LGTTTVPPQDWEFNPDSNVPKKAQSVLAISLTSTILSFIAIPFYWYALSHLPEPRTPFETRFVYVIGPAMLFSVSYSLAFLWFGLVATANESEFKNPIPRLLSCAWAILGIPAGSVLFNEALATPRGFITKLCYLFAGCALLAESVIVIRLTEAWHLTARKRPKGER
jgi:hypothetical protein